MGANKALKIKDLANLSDSDLAAKIAEAKADLTKTTFTHAIASLENPLILRSKRRDIAKMMTQLNARKKAK
jgi:large subunit ribosomal protein L29